MIASADPSTLGEWAWWGYALAALALVSASTWAIRSTPDAAAAPATEPVSPRALTTEEGR